ncbi:MAG: hypothetical protein KJN93_09300, partial [Alphaproteobacteria bacterium]|nr:hypothetical protein [Alphaproteobacteria bacterium]
MHTPRPSRTNAALRIALRLCVLALLLWGAFALMDWVEAQTDRATTLAALVFILLLYAVLLAVPFMPGIEIGFSVLVMRGAEAAPYVWIATVLGLCLAFWTGRMMPAAWLIGTFEDLRMARTAQLVKRLSDTPPDLRLRFLYIQAPRWVRPALREWRYLLLAALLNLPGNAVIGGGGGLALLSGLSGVFSARGTMLTFALATAPFPILVWFFGPQVLPWT